MHNVPEKLGKYNILGEIGCGSMGVVYSAHDPYSRRDVAIKLTHLDSEITALDRQQREIFFREVHTISRLLHPNIIRLHDANEDEDNCYIVMELVRNGETLKTYCNKNNLLSPDKVAHIIFKCARALDYAHKRGVIHRDIKPSNILVKENFDIRICDFGIAHMQKVDFAIDAVMGSPKYMSPEQLKGEEVSRQSDLFSLGIVMYEMLIGESLFVARDLNSLTDKIITKEIPPLPDHFPDSLREIFAKAMEKDTEKRYQSGEQLAIDLSRAFSLGLPGKEISETDRFALVRQLDFFQGFPDTELQEIMQTGTWQEYGKDEGIIIEGEMDDCFYVIISGEVSVEKYDGVISTISAGDCFGEMGYLTKTKRTATIKSVSDTVLLKINSALISEVSLKCQVRFLKVFLRTLIQRLSTTTDVIHQSSKLYNTHHPA